MNHYCTYFDSGFMIQGLALWDSLQRHDPKGVLWVLALDASAADALVAITDARLRTVPLPELEAGDAGLRAAKGDRSKIEYYFTLSPCWPRWLLGRYPEIAKLMYLDADLFFFASPARIWEALDRAQASVVITPHRFPPFLQDLGVWGRYNVGIQIFRNDTAGIEVLEDWRARCLGWCRDVLEGERFADQKYLDAWPQRFGRAVHVLDDPGVNLAPWNWAGHRCGVEGGEVRVDGLSLVVFHFAKFRPLSARLWDSGQADYGVMPRRLRNAIYGSYAIALEAARTGPVLAGRFAYRRVPMRALRGTLRLCLVWLCFGSLWLRTRRGWIALGCAPLGRRSVAWWIRRRSRRRTP